MPKLVKKVLVYVTRGDEILVFRHRDFPDAGLQVPGGTIDEGEKPDDAVMREVFEESGLADVRLVRFLGQYMWDASVVQRDEIHQRHVYHLELIGQAPSEWEFGAHVQLPHNSDPEIPTVPGACV